MRNRVVDSNNKLRSDSESMSEQLEPLNSLRKAGRQAVKSMYNLHEHEQQQPCREQGRNYSAVISGNSLQAAGWRDRWCSVWTVVVCARGSHAIHMHARMHVAVNMLAGINQEEIIRRGCDSILGILGIGLLVKSTEKC